ncbi:FIVAR domain-containing protein [Mycoplasma tullyi]|uniref:FIVAR domain-containing protein n=1 Tax=Mycoplasma tullyi TaxID=1612150 RepID=A0A7D7U3U0_9MOLU|nr:FIVAR domain-containing protein [Mycoplasma tullyi]QMT98430.1 FIVAR domain-containing protein [Mycoplasma tullyi]
MNKKNIIKFVSLLGVGSFVMLAATSCTKNITLTSNSKTTSDTDNTSNTSSNNNTNSGSSAEMNNVSRSGAKTNTTDQPLATPRQTLIDLIGTENNNINLYSDYGQILSDLRSAYKTAKNASKNTNATLAEIKSIETTLQAAINKAATDKQTFDNNNRALVTAYNELKTTLQSKTTTLEGLTEERYSGIKHELDSLYDVGAGIINQKLDSISGTNLAANTVVKANKDIKDALSALDSWKTNANALATSYIKQALVKDKLTGIDSNNTVQPGNYSFAGYSVDVTSDSSAHPNWSFAQRKAWTSNENIFNSPQPVTDISWIYGIAGTNAKYTLTFNYYGSSTGYLYFPYKLVKTGDNVGLQYKLNNAPNPTEITFGDMGTDNGKTPTVGDINVAKVALPNLNFGANTIEFSVPTSDSTKVAPMIGNMYLTSNSDNADQIYDNIFGNNTSQDDSVSVDLLNGYSLGANYSMLFYRLSNYTENSVMQTNKPAYLVGFIGGSGERIANNTTAQSNYVNFNRNPITNGSSRTLTIYVNAPKTGEYSIHSTYIYSAGNNNTTGTRSIKFSTDSSNDTNAVSITVKSLGSWSILGKIDTSSSDTSGITTGSKRTLNLQQGLNKVIVSQVSGDTPYIGNLTFTLSDTPQVNAVNNTNENNAEGGSVTPESR